MVVHATLCEKKYDYMWIMPWVIIMETKKTVSDAQKKAHRKYMERFVEVKVRMTPEKRAEIQAHALEQGESATAFINRAISETMDRDRPK